MNLSTSKRHLFSNYLLSTCLVPGTELAPPTPTGGKVVTSPPSGKFCSNAGGRHQRSASGTTWVTTTISRYLEVLSSAIKRALSLCLGLSLTGRGDLGSARAGKAPLGVAIGVNKREQMDKYPVLHPLVRQLRRSPSLWWW